jgi:hypothetical protein
LDTVKPLPEPTSTSDEPTTPLQILARNMANQSKIKGEITQLSTLANDPEAKFEDLHKTLNEIRLRALENKYELRLLSE